MSFPNPNTCKEKFEDIDVIELSKLIDIKLASDHSLPLQRPQDLADVVELIKYRKFLHVFCQSIGSIDIEQSQFSNHFLLQEH